MNLEMVARTIQLIIVFMLGVASQLIGVIYAVCDAFKSHKIFTFETRHALFLEKSGKEHLAR